MQKQVSGITLIALVITIVILLILAGISISLILGENGIIEKNVEANEKYKISEMQEMLELEKKNLIIDKKEELPSIEEFISYLVDKDIINIADVLEINDNIKEIILNNYIFLIEEEEDKNIKITYNGIVSDEPRIGKIEITQKQKKVLP